MSSNRGAYLWAIALDGGLESVPKIEPQGGKLGLPGRLRAYNHSPPPRDAVMSTGIYIGAIVLCDHFGVGFRVTLKLPVGCF